MNNAKTIPQLLIMTLCKSKDFAQSIAIMVLETIVKIGARTAFIIIAPAIFFAPPIVSQSLIVLYILAAWWAIRPSTPGNRPGHGQNS